MTKIYTRTGDKGETSLYTGARVPKNDVIIEAVGTVDETNSAIGVALSMMPREANYSTIREQLETIQHALFDIGAALATPRTRAVSSKLEKTRFGDEAVHHLEKWMDSFEDQLAPLKTFILPGGQSSGAMLHLARSICRRAERLIVPLNLQADVSDSVLAYLNRLSDYLFMVSRVVNHMMGSPETKWEPHKGLT